MKNEEKNKYELINHDGKIYFKKTYTTNYNLYENEKRINKLISSLDVSPKMISYSDEEHSIIFDNINGNNLKAFDLDDNTKLNIIIELARKISILHRMSIIHCDLKPSNIFVDKDNKVYILDFASAKLIGETPETYTFKYSPIKQFQHDKVSYDYDMYSFGILMYEILTGDKDFYPDTREGLEDKMSEYLSICTSNEHFDESIDIILLKLISSGKNYQYHDMGEVIEDLLEVQKKTINAKSM